MGSRLIRSNSAGERVVAKRRRNVPEQRTLIAGVAVMARTRHEVRFRLKGALRSPGSNELGPDAASAITRTCRPLHEHVSSVVRDLGTHFNQRGLAVSNLPQTLNQTNSARILARVQWMSRDVSSQSF